MKSSGITLLVAALATSLLLVPSSAWAEPVPPAPPIGQSLHGIDWTAKQIALINTKDASLTLGSGSVAGQLVEGDPRDYPEGAGFDAATGSV